MVTRIVMQQFLDDYLQISQFKDYAPNGLQVEGKMKITRIRTAVTASLDVIQKAIADEADALLVHHGYFWQGESAPILGIKRQRMMHLLAHDINLFAYHLPLDCHLAIGNNACMAERLQVIDVKQHKVGATSHLLWTGSFPEAMTSENLICRLQDIYLQRPQCIIGHTRPIAHIAFCTGAAQDLLEKASDLQVDAFLSGEVSERTYYQAKELGVNYYACGHHATERDGIQALGAHLAAQFGVEHAFIDSDNPI